MSSSGLVPSDFVHLHNHTHHSLLDGLQKVPAMVERVAELGMEAVAATDHGTLSGAIELYKQAKERNIKPIIGMEAYVAERKHTDKDPHKDKQRAHLVLLAMNNQGYENLMRLSTIANLDGFYHKPRLDRDLLEKYNAGLIVLSGCIGSEVGRALRGNNYKEAKKAAEWYKKVFGERYFLEVQDHGHMWAEQKTVNDLTLKLANELEIECVVTADAHYLKHEDQEAHEVLLCVQTGSFLADQDRMSLKDTDLYLSDPKDIIKRWSDYPDLIKNTKKIADMCHVDIDLGGILIPRFDVPEGESERSYLHKQVWRGLAWRYGGVEFDKSLQLSVEEAKSKLDKEVLERAEFELEVIANMGFDGYFLIVSDFIVWGKDRDIVFGPGRGSAAGSIVAYAMRITELDPLKYDLLFERFLNPDRISMPDIDIDIQDSRRDEVIQYCVDKYGQDKVAHIVTFGKMAARNAIRDVARVLEVPYAEADRLAKMVPPPVQGRHIPLEVSVKENRDLKTEYENNEQSKRVIDLAIKIEGTIRSHGVHAAGVVIAPDDIVKFTPLEMAQKGVITTQYPMGPVEELGLLKMDFLGLSNLTIIKNALRIIKKVYKKDIDITALPLDDKKTYELLSRGDTTGVFQFESGGMKRYLKQLKPEVFEDIVAMGALYRPGPLTAGLTDKFIARKNGLEPVVYDHEKMKEALGSTYGVLVYQEQVMRIARDMCGFTGGEADTLRKAIGKKKVDLMAKMKVQFIEGMVEHSGVKKAFAEKFWKDLEGFADYAFNKSHSACYGLISYQTAYLKAHYPDAFMAALMTSDYDDTDRLAIEISECIHMGIEVLPPSVNESYPEFAVVPGKNQIRFGMAAVKNVGMGAVEEIVRVRDLDGEFKSVEDFVSRVSTRIVNRKAWESLIKSGAFDEFNKRAELLLNLDTILAYGSKMQKEAESGQVNLFGESEESVAADLRLEAVSSSTPEKEILQWERELLGIYLSKHPLDGYEEYIEDKATPISEITPSMDGRKVVVGGVIGSIKEITTKKGAKMAFITLEDKTSELELIAFPESYNEYLTIWEQDNIVIVEGKVSTKDRDGKNGEEIKILVSSVKLVNRDLVNGYKPKKKKKAKKEPAAKQVNAEPQAKPSRIYIHVKDPEDDDKLMQLKRIIDTSPGELEVILVFGDDNKRAVRLPMKVELQEEIKRQITEIFSSECVAVK